MSDEPTEKEHVRTFDMGGDEAVLERLDGVTDERAEKATESQQVDTDDHAAVNWHEPPYPPRKLALTAEANETVARCATAISRNVCGYGFSLVSDEGGDSDADPPSELEDFWHDGDFSLGPDNLPSAPETVFEHAYKDRILMGYGAVELLLNDDLYQPTGASHVPAHTIRRRKGAPGYVQLDGGRPVTFYGPPGGRANGVFVDTDGNVGGSSGEVGMLANELLVDTEYSALAPHYGIPPTVPAYQTISADASAREYQYRFFENDGVPRFAVIVSGGELTERAWNQLEDQLKNLKGVDDAHRGILIEATGDAVAGAENSVDVEIQPLTAGETEEAGFIEYRKENEHDIGQAFGCPPVVYNRTENANYSTARQQMRQFAQTEIHPRQEQLAAWLAKLIHGVYFETEGWTLDWILKGGQNELRESEIASNNAAAVKTAKGVITPDEARTEFFDLGPMEEADGETISEVNAPDIAPDDQQPPVDESQPPDNAPDDE